MATSNVVPKQDIPVVLRVKRKRTENPADELVIRSKVPKSDTEAQPAASPGIFQLCGSIDQSSDIMEKHTNSILDIVKSFKSRLNQSKVNPLANLTLDDSKEKRRIVKKKSSSNQRYKLLSSLRCLGEEGSDVVQVYDALDCGMEQDNSSTEITCNSSVMTRQKVKLTGDDDFVIDIYYGNQLNMESLQDVVVSPYEAELVHDIFDTDEERYEDEDDSNDECNWRNDYPNEDDSNGEDSCSLDSNQEYRHRDMYYDEYDWERADEYSSGGDY